MHVVQSYQKNEAPQYVKALLHCTGKKVCTNLANTINRSHDSIYRALERASEKQETQTNQLETLAHNELNQNETYLIHDDTQLTKLYAKEIEGIDVGFDGSIGKVMLGLKVITSLLTDTCVSVPIEAMPYISKELAKTSYKTKSEIAIDVTKHVAKHFKIKRMLADAHFATNKMIMFLNNEQLSYLMKIPRNRVATINGIIGQLKNILRLKRNNRVKSVVGFFNGIKCHFYVIKIKNGTTVYFISNDQIDPFEVISIYKIRWNIEMFHRTSKQSLGLGDCQMRSIEKQRQHMLFVMHAYALASVQKNLMNLSCIEDVIKHLRNVKSKNFARLKHSIEGNFGYVA